MPVMDTLLLALICCVLPGCNWHGVIVAIRLVLQLQLVCAKLQIVHVVAIELGLVAIGMVL